MNDSQLAALARAATPGPWVVDWYECRASDAEEAKAGNCKVGDVMWRVARSIGPVSPDHNHWAGHYVADEADAAHIAAWSPERALAALAVIAAAADSIKGHAAGCICLRCAEVNAWRALAKALAKGSEG